MKFYDAIIWVWRAVWMNRGRSTLTVVGFAIGIAAMVMLSSFGEGLRLFVLKEFTQFGSHIVTLRPGRSTTIGIEGLLKTTRPMTINDAWEARRIPGVEKVVPSVMGQAVLEANNRTRISEVIGLTAHAAVAFSLQLQKGAFLPEGDFTRARDFMVLGGAIKDEMFGNKNAVGEFVHLNGSRFRVIGVLEDKGQFMGQDFGTAIFIPVARAMQLFNRDSLMELNLFYSPSYSSKVIADSAKELMIRRHGFEDFTVTSQDEMLATLDNILNILKYAGGGLGAISLLVGGVGILTILMITVSERTQEVGLLRAMGATRRQVRNLFLGEAIFLALAGGTIGILSIGVFQMLIKLAVPGLPISMTPAIILGALIVSTLIGVISGVKPAMNATELSPIDALRGE